MRKQEQAHSCKEWQQAIDLLLDHVVTAEQSNQEILNEIEQCPVCKQYYQNQTAYKTQLHKCKSSTRCSDTLKDNVLNAIRGLA
ncbi:MAG: hypothetical protein H6553_11935 [Chitinophagales bacterium]|nr:hypothetical protein [Chitinophagales bacterium]